MPLSDTQRLVASLELQDKFSGTAGRATRALGGIETATGRVERRLGVFGHAAGTALGIGLERAISGGVRLLTGAITGGVEALNELESVTTATNTVIASTQGVAGQTASDIRELAEEYETLNATIGDDVIQSGANMLLTFTNIREKAFEPALEAALNMNEAMGGGPEGLQNTIIQVGKALNDPIQGVGALRRVGVQLSDQQEDQIKTLIEQNDLYGAQRVILDELATQFGGRFAAAGKDAEGRQAALVDRTEDLQKALAGPLIPAIDRAREKLITLFESPAAIAASTKLGDTIAGLFTEENLGRAVDVIDDGLRALSTFDFNKVGDGVQKVFGFLGEVPWGAIGEGLRITGAATKVVVDAFLALPKEVQGIAIAALAVNKLSGGLAGGLVGAGGRGLIDLFRGRGQTPVAPLYVQNVGLSGTTPGPGVGAGGLGRLLVGLTGVGLAAMLADEFEEEIQGFAEDTRNALGIQPINLPSGPNEWQWPFGNLNAPDWARGNEGIPDSKRWTPDIDFGKAGSSGFGISALQALIDRIKAATTVPDTAMGLPDTAMQPLIGALGELTTELRNERPTGPLAPAGSSGFGIGDLQDMVSRLQERTRAGGGNFVESVKLDPSQVTDLREPTRIAAEQLRAIDAWNKLQGGQLLSKQEQVAAAVRSQSGLLGQIRDKSQSVTVKVQNNVQVGVSEIQYRIQSLTTSIGGGVDPAGSRAR